MSDVSFLLSRQASWQSELRDLTWEEKIRMAEAVRESVILLRRSVRDPDNSRQNNLPPASTEPLADPAAPKAQ